MIFLRNISQPLNFQIRLNGYDLYDAETFQIVDGYLLMEVFISIPSKLRAFPEIPNECRRVYLSSQ